MYRSFSVSTLGFQVCRGQDLTGFLVEKIERKAYVGEKKIILSDNTIPICASYAATLYFILHAM